MRYTWKQHIAGMLGFVVAWSASAAVVGLSHISFGNGSRQTVTVARRTYTQGNCAWVGCAAIPGPNWDGCGSGHGITYECSDGSTLVVVEDECTSAKAGHAQLDRLVNPPPEERPITHVVAHRTVATGVLLEFGDPVDVGVGCPVTGALRYAVANVGPPGLRTIYGPSADHVQELAHKLGWG